MNVLPDAHYTEGLKLLPNDRTMRMHTYICVCVCVRMCVTVIMGFCVGTFNFLYCILWVRWVSTLWANSSCSHLGLGILGMCVQACPPPPLSLALLPLRVMIMTSYNVKVVYRNFGFRSFLFFLFHSKLNYA